MNSFEMSMTWSTYNYVKGLTLISESSMVSNGILPTSPLIVNTHN
jgi:hypothetical protein